MRLKLILIALSFLLINFINTSHAESDEVVILHTKSGNLTIEFFPEDAPNHVENFLNLTKNGFYDRTIFHRVIKDFMIQGGDPLTKPEAYETASQWGTGDPGYKIKAEFNNIKHNRGIVSMARSSDPNSAGSQFFIVHKDSNFLDGQYTVFGRLATQESYETLDKIATLDTPYSVGDAAQNELGATIPIKWGEGEILKAEVVSRSEVSDLLDLGEPERETESPTQTFNEEYSSDKFGFSIKFPLGWSVQEIENPNPVVPDVAAVEPKADGIPSSISVLIQNSTGRTLEQFMEEWKKQYLQSAIDRGILVIQSEEKTTINGLEAVILNVDGAAVTTTGEIKIKYKEATIAGPDKFYKVSYTSTEEEFGKNLQNFENTLSTFKTLSKSNNESNDYYETKGGGCLIATATFGTELAPQVQQLRETRDNILLKTESGKSFLKKFNQLYYSFSPTISDLERQNPIFKETTKIVITPLLTSLSILNYLDIDSEAEMIGYGISLIALNIGMYFVAPAYVIHKFRK
jgi:peptidyl-prolyl cis-trans isomerase B (cyclophilin B)